MLRPFAVVTLTSIVLAGCGDVPLRGDGEAYRPSRVTVSGRVCTDDPLAVGFPLKVLFVIDASSAINDSANDAQAARFRAVQRAIGALAPRPETSFGLVVFGARAENLVPDGFTRDAAALTVTRTHIPGGRDLVGALDLASSIIVGDALRAPRGDLARTSYALVLLAAGGSAPAKPCDCAALAADASACREQAVVARVRELARTVKDAGAASLSLHTTYLPDAADYSAAPSSVFAPLCSVADDRARAADLLGEVALVGAGAHHQIGAASAIDFFPAELLGRAPVLAFKSLIVTNLNVVAGADGPRLDSDQDGLPDDVERALGTCPADRDTDGDGISDGIEVKLGSGAVQLDPRVADDPIACVDLARRQEVVADPCDPSRTKVQLRYVDAAGVADGDGDTLGPCEERLLGTDPTLTDSDGDGIPDHVELLSGVNYLAADEQVDSDFDGRDNRDEVRAHTDPTSDDSDSALDRAYRYVVEARADEQLPSAQRPRTCVRFRVQNITLLQTLAADGRAAGDNSIAIYFAQRPQDAARHSGGLFRAASVTMRYRRGPPEVRTPMTGEVTVPATQFTLLR